MKKKIIFILCVVAALIICITGLISNNKHNSDIKETSTTVTENNLMSLEINYLDNNKAELYIDLNKNYFATMTLEIFFDINIIQYEKNMENSNYNEGRLLYTWVSENGRNQQIEKIGPFIFKIIKEDESSKVTVNGDFYNETGERVNVDSQSIEIPSSKQTINEEVQDEDVIVDTSKDSTNLAILRLNHEGISPEFSNDIKEYYIVINETIDKFDITAVAENPKSTVSITGNNNLKIGLNTININVKSEDKTKEINYKIYVTKTSDLEKANANLENLAVEYGILVPEFDANITNYKVEVGNDVEIANVLAVPEKINAKVNINKNSKWKIGDNNVEITVTAEDGITKKKYIITVHRRDNEEEDKLEEETKQQGEKLSAIIKENNNIKENNVEETNEEENEERQDLQEDIYVYISGGIAILIVIICKLYDIAKKKKK